MKSPRLPFLLALAFLAACGDDDRMAIDDGGSSPPDATVLGDAWVLDATTDAALIDDDFTECTEDAQCLRPRVCTATADDPTGFCEPLPTRGERCLGFDERCAEGLECVESICRQPGATDCITDAECPNDGEWCDQPGNDWRVDNQDDPPPGACVAPRALGEPCDAPRACAEGRHCDNEGMFEPDGWRSPGVCADLLEAGSECREGGQCRSERCEDGRCQ